MNLNKEKIMQLSNIGEVDLDKLEKEMNEEEKIEKLRKLASAPVHCTAFEGQRKRAKLKKKFVCALCSAIVNFTLLGAGFAAMTACSSKASDIIEKSGYDEANALYKAEMTMDVHESFVNGELSLDEYKKKVNDIKDLDKYEHVKTTLGQEEYERLKSLRNGEMAGTCVLLGTTITTGVAGGMTLVYATQEEREKIMRDARDARHARMLGGK